jgi:hypothetical protein
MTLLPRLLAIVREHESRQALKKSMLCESGPAVWAALASIPGRLDRAAAARAAVEALSERSPALQLTRALLSETESPSTELQLSRTGLTLADRPSWALSQVARELLTYHPADTVSGGHEAERLTRRALEFLLQFPEHADLGRLGLGLIHLVPRRSRAIGQALLRNPFQRLAATCLELLDLLQEERFREGVVSLLVETLSRRYRNPVELLELELARQNTLAGQSLHGLRAVVMGLAA